MNLKKKLFDDLTKIQDIGDKRQLRLRKACNIKTYEDLASCSVEEIELGLESDGQGRVSKKTIANWIEEAKKIVKAKNISPAIYSNANAKVVQNKQANVLEERVWTEAFVIEFCTLRKTSATTKREVMVYPLKISKKGDWLENGESKGSPNVFKNEAELLSWIKQQFSLPEQNSEAETAQTNEKGKQGGYLKTNRLAKTQNQYGALSKNQIIISQVSAYQPTDATQPVWWHEQNREFGRLLTEKKIFCLEVGFLITEFPNNVKGDSKIDYWAEFHLHNIMSGDYISLGQTKSASLLANTFSYTARLKNISLPAGGYRLGVQLKFNNSPPLIKHLDIPVFQVITS